MGSGPDPSPELQYMWQASHARHCWRVWAVAAGSRDSPMTEREQSWEDWTGRCGTQSQAHTGITPCYLAGVRAEI